MKLKMIFLLGKLLKKKKNNFIGSGKKDKNSFNDELNYDLKLIQEIGK